jgi:NADH-quinone oxidoreductase subunit N
VNPLEIVNEIVSMLPANVMLLGGILLLIAGFFPKNIGREGLSLSACACIGLAALALLLAKVSTTAGTGLFQFDSVSNSASWLALLGGFLVILVGWQQVPKKRESEYYSSLLLMVSGLIYASAATDLTTLFLGLELVSIPTIVLLAISGSTNLNRESTLKYFTLSAFSSAFFLLGCSYLYGASGSTSLEIITSSQANPAMMKVGLALAACGLFFRLTAVPFHFYAPDLFAGSNLTLASGLAFLPKLAGIIGLLRLLDVTNSNYPAAQALVPLMMVAAMVTMTVGNFAALRQQCLRRMLAYSGVAHSGYLLAGAASIVVLGKGAAILTDYLAAYAVMSFAVFAILLLIEPKEENPTSSLHIFDGLYLRNPWLAIVGTVALCSQIGLPPTAGFWAKFQLFASAIGANRIDLRMLAIAMAINAAIGAVIYLSLVARIFRRGEEELNSVNGNHDREAAFAPNFACAICTMLTLVWFLSP